jgi:transcriptional regulator PpsR
MNQFQAPDKNLENLDSRAAASLIAAASDIALIIDHRGVIRDVSCANEDISSSVYRKWLGRPWAETVTAESRPKIESLLRDAAAHNPVRGRQVNHPIDNGMDLPIMYSAVPINDKGKVLAVGRDLRTESMLQQRLLEVQQNMERDYARMRQFETRYRLLFQTSEEAVIIADGRSLKIVEANPAATAMLGIRERPITDEPVCSLLVADGPEPLRDLLVEVRASGKPLSVRAQSVAREAALNLTVTVFRQDRNTLFLLRAERADAPTKPSDDVHYDRQLHEFLDAIPDAMVLTDPAGKILTANTEFLDLAQLASPELAVGQQLSRWLGQPGVEFRIIMSNLREHGTLRLYRSQIRGQYGSNAEVELSAVSIPEGELPCLGFIIRNVSRRREENSQPRDLPKSVEELTRLVGKVPMRDLVRESTEIIEQLCIEAALKLTGDNRASAAELLGLSRQSLYVKLRRMGVAESQ